MAFSQWLLLKVPSLLLGLSVVGLFAGLSVIGLTFVRSFIPHQRLKPHNDVAGAIFATMGVIYAVLLAFAVVIVWEGFDRANINAEKEAAYLADLYRDAETLSPQFRDSVRPLVREYAAAVCDEEWPAMARGGKSSGVEEILKKLWRVYGGYSPKTEAERIFFEESVRKLNDLGELRSMRLVDAKTGVHPLLWVILIIGGLVTVSFTFFFGSENLRAQILMAALLAALIALILFAILLLDFPFTGDVCVSKEPFRQLLLN
ncbi:MAG: DUF4239 domain-containing protein [Candidatus Omnitrophica bacterium]|nr:DUF4239 domain-containing protein [Candidatus Omnitrophota bacterium]